MSTDFVEFPKIARLSREVFITEKIDGTNGLIQLTRYDSMCGCVNGLEVQNEDGARFDMLVGSRTKWITPKDDNYGFASWAYEHASELVKLGAGRHFGEWWGQGIQRRYGLHDKRWSLFNVGKWSDPAARPSCCHVVPVLSQGIFTDFDFDGVIERLRENGSYAAPGFMNPEGIIVYHVAGNLYFKKTIHKDQEWKGKTA